MNQPEDEQLLINEVKLLLAEKRTYLAMFRTGVAILGLSLTALGVLVFEGNFLNVSSVELSPLVAGFLIVIAVIGGWLIYRSRQRINHINSMIERVEEKNQRIADILIE